MLGIFIDLETTGLDIKKHRVLELAFKIVDLSHGSQLNSYQSTVFQPLEVWEKSDPESLAVNGFTYDLIEDALTEEEVAEKVTEILNSHKINRNNSMFIGQNPSFDRGFFELLIDVYDQEKMGWPYHWLDFASMYWALEVKRRQTKQFGFDELSLSKDAIAESCNIPPEEKPHRAMNGVEHLLLCYEHVVGFPLPAIC